jgi:hypothetical protein
MALTELQKSGVFGHAVFVQESRNNEHLLVVEFCVAFVFGHFSEIMGT